MVLAVAFTTHSTAPAQATAGSSCFCPAQPCATQGRVLVGGNKRCVSAHYNGLTRVHWFTFNGPGVYHCAGAKSNRDGSGSNVIPFVCTSERRALTPLYHCRPGYATGLNESSSAHYFFGYTNWDTACSV
jgi:hypothetical protein